MAAVQNYDSSVPRIRIRNDDLLKMLTNKKGSTPSGKSNSPPKTTTNSNSKPKMSSSISETKADSTSIKTPRQQHRHVENKSGIQIYRPGEGLLKKSTPDLNNVDTTTPTTTNSSPRDSRCATPVSSSSMERKNKQKRPDIARYVAGKGFSSTRKSEEKIEVVEEKIVTPKNCVNVKPRSKSDDLTKMKSGITSTTSSTKKEKNNRTRREMTSRRNSRASKSMNDVDDHQTPRRKSDINVKILNREPENDVVKLRDSRESCDVRQKTPQKDEIIVNGDRKNPEGVDSVEEDPPTKLDWGEEMEKDDWLRNNKNNNNHVHERDFELADVESCSSPPKALRKRNKKKKRRTKSESERSPTEKRSEVTSTAKTGGIIRLPTTTPSRTLSAPVQIDSRNDHTTAPRHLYDPKHPNQPKIVYPHHDHHHHHQRGQRDDGGSGGGGGSSYGGGYGEYGGGGGANQYGGYGNYNHNQHDVGYYAQPTNSQCVDGEVTVTNSPKITTARRNIHEAAVLEPELNLELSKSFPMIDQKKLGQLRWKIQLRYENAILSDVEFCGKHNIEQALWKAAFYQVIETYRKQMVEYGNQNDTIRDILLGFIEEGVIFYENLLEKLQEQYGFNLSTFLDSEAVRPPLQRHVKMALVSAQKVLICLGDLARYKEQANETAAFGKARTFYLKAQQLAPKNGRPYNQLAILALYARRKLDAVYYYMRSLAASTPFPTAKEGLDLVFDEARKKYEQVEKERLELRNQRQNKEPPVQENSRYREEIWYLPDGSPASHSDQEQVDESDEELNRLSTTDLNKKFVLSFIHALGKLFTRIDLDNFVDVASQLVRELACLLKQSPLPLNSTRLLQLMAMNMYAVQHTELKGIEPNCSGLLQVHALQLSFEMLAVMLNRSTTLLREHLTSDESIITFLSADLQQLLPPIKVWCDWLMCHVPTWNNPRPAQSDYRNNGEPDVWTLLADFMSLIKQLDGEKKDVVIAAEQIEGWEVVTLPEDTALAGFVPLLAMPQEVSYVSPEEPTDKECIRNIIRLRRFVLCAEFLCGISPPVLRYSVPDQAYKSVLTESSSDCSEPELSNDAPVPLELSVGSTEERSVNEESMTSSVCGGSGRSEMDELRCRKEELTRRKADQDRHQQQVQAVLSETSLSRTRLEIIPHYLIPDTNCFIDHLDDIKRLVSTGQFQLTIPLVVVNELDGLSKGCRTDRWRTECHNRKVSVGAKEALEFLNGVFPARNNRVRAVTAHGTELDKISFRSEDMLENVGSNDDVILKCCLKYCKKDFGGEKIQNKDGVTRIKRRVVLLTDDRALRVKAINNDVPVRDIPSFMHKMHIS